MTVCGQCGETAIVGGFCSIPDKPINERWRCLSCLLADVKAFNKAKGRKTDEVLVVKQNLAPRNDKRERS